MAEEMQQQEQVAEEQQQQAAAAAEEQQQATEEASESATEENEQKVEGEQQKPKGGFQKKIDKLTRAVSDKDREIEYLRGIAFQRQQQQSTQKTETAPAADVRPKADDYENREEYEDALVDWRIKQRDNVAKAAGQEERVRTERKTNLDRFKDRQAELVIEDPDYEEYVEDTSNMSPAMIEEIVTHEHGPALHRYILQNPEEAKRLSQMGPMQLAREVGKLESKFVTPNTQQRSAAAVSKAPPPPKISGRSSSNSEEDWENTTDFKKFEAGWNKRFPGRR